MIGMVITLRIKPGKQQDFETIFAERQVGVRANEPGNLAYELYRVHDDDEKYIIVERYASDEAYRYHLALSTSHEAMLACFASPPEAVHLRSVGQGVKA